MFLILEGIFHAFPATPLAHGLVDISQTCALIGIGRPIVSQHRQFTSLGQILVDLDDGVEFFWAGIFVHLAGGDTGSPAIAHLIIIGMDIPEVAIELIAHHTQQIVVEDSRIDTLYDKGLVGLVLHLRQLFTEFRRQLWGLHLEFLHAVLLSDSIEYGLVHRLEHYVFCGLPAFDDMLNGRFQ